MPIRLSRIEYRITDFLGSPSNNQLNLIKLIFCQFIGICNQKTIDDATDNITVNKIILVLNVEVLLRFLIPKLSKMFWSTINHVIDKPFQSTSFDII